MHEPPVCPPSETNGPRPDVPAVPADEAIFATGLVLWVVVFVATWPTALSFADEIGYIGQAKLLLRGHVSPHALDPGMWVTGPNGTASRYPLTLPLLIAPLLAITPRATFVLGALAAVATAIVASRLLKHFGRSPVWGLVVLAHPSIVLLSRTVMTDVVFSACTLGAWLAARSGAVHHKLFSFALLVCIKPTGGIVAAALLAGELLRIPASRGNLRTCLARQAPAALGGALGLLLLLAMNLVSTGSFRFGYDFVLPADVATFSIRYVGHNALSYAPALLLSPPLLLLGALSLWRRRELGALLSMAALGALMLSYFFVDRGATWLESLVLAPRLILPVIGVLLVGYADLLAGLCHGLLQRRRSQLPLQAALVGLMLATAGAISLVHQRWQRPFAYALDRASQQANLLPERTLAITRPALKQGLLYAGTTQLFDARTSSAHVVLCGTVSASHRLEKKKTFSCAYPGYRVASQGQGFKVLVRAP